MSDRRRERQRRDIAKGEVRDFKHEGDSNTSACMEDERKEPQPGNVGGLQKMTIIPG